METKANYAAVGLFVVVLLATGLAFLFWLSDAGERAKQIDIKIVFSDPVSGLITGSNVLFNGIKVGEISSIALDPDNPSNVVAIARVNRSVPLKTDTSAKLSSQGLTGVSELSLEGGSRNAESLISATKAGELPTIPAEVSPFQDIVESTRRLLNRTDGAMKAIDTFITENKQAVYDSVQNVDHFTAALAANSNGMRDLVTNLSAASKSVGKLSDSLNGSSKKIEDILAAVDPAKVRDMVAKANQAVDETTAAAEHLHRLVAAVDPATVTKVEGDIAESSAKLKETVETTNKALAAISPESVNEITKNLRSAAGDIAAFSRSINDRSADVAGVISESRALVSTLRTVAGNLDYFVNKANAMVSDGKSGGLVAEASETLKSIHTLADTLNAKAGPIADNLGRFSDRGLSNIDQLATDLRRSLDLIDRLAISLQRNPSQVIFGGDKVPEYQPRR